MFTFKHIIALLRPLSWSFIILSSSIFAGNNWPLAKVTLPAKSPERYAGFYSYVNKINEREIKTTLDQFILSGHPSRMVGKPGHEKARAFLQQTVQQFSQGQGEIINQEFSPDTEYAKKIYQEDFEREIVPRFPSKDPNYLKWKVFTDSTITFLDKLKTMKGVNIVWKKEGSIDPDSVLIFAANYDGVTHDPKTLLMQEKTNSANADDNGSGVVVALHLIRLLASQPLPKTVMVVFTDFGQFASLGAHHFRLQNKDLLSSPKLTGYIELMMLGHDSKDKDGEKRLGNMRLYGKAPGASGAERESKLASWLIEAGAKAIPGIQFPYTPNGFRHGGAHVYQDMPVPTLTFTQNWETDLNPHFHTPNDFAEGLNFQTLTKSCKFILAGAMAWAYDIVR